MLLAAVGHTAVHVADWGDVVLVVDGAVVEVDDEVDVLLLHPTAATESAASVAAAANRRFIMISSCHQVHGLGRAKGPEHRYGYPRRAVVGQATSTNTLTRGILAWGRPGRLGILRKMFQI